MHVFVYYITYMDIKPTWNYKKTQDALGKNGKMKSMLSGKIQKTFKQDGANRLLLSQLDASYVSFGPDRGKHKEESLEQEIDCPRITSPP